MRVPICLDSPHQIVDALAFNAALSPQQLVTKRADTDSFQFCFGRPFTGAEEVDFGASSVTLKFGAKVEGDFAGDYVLSNWDGAVFAYAKSFRKQVTDGVTTSSSPTLTSATAGWAASDVGKAITGAGIPAGTTIQAVGSVTSITMSANATASGTGVGLTIPKRTPLYTVNVPNSHELNILLVDGTVKASVADQTARFALVGWANGEIAYQESDGTSWVVIDNAQLNNASGWGPADQKESVTLDAEVELNVDGVVMSSVTFDLVVYSDVNRGNEGVPRAAAPGYPSPRKLLALEPLVTGLTGGGSTKLDGIVTTTIDVSMLPYVLGILHTTDGLVVYKLVPGTDAEASPGVIRPDDYDGSTNAKVWKKVL